MAAPAPPRAPGMGPIWQARDEGWPTLKLGLEHGWPSKPIDEAISEGTERSAEPGTPPQQPGPPTANPEDHDPRPAAQPDEDGSL